MVGVELGVRIEGRVKKFTGAAAFVLPTRSPPAYDTVGMGYFFVRISVGVGKPHGRPDD